MGFAVSNPKTEMKNKIFEGMHGLFFFSNNFPAFRAHLFSMH